MKASESNEEVLMLTSLRGKMTLPTLGMLFIVVGFIAVYFSTLTANRASSFAEQRMDAAAQSVSAYLASLEQQTFIAVMALGGSAELIRLIDGGDRLGVWDYLVRQKTLFGVTSIIVTDTEGRAFARSALRDLHGDDVSGGPSISAGLRREIVTLYMPTPTAPLVMTSAAPIMDGDRLVGTVAVNFDVATSEFVDRIRETFDIDATVFAGASSVSSTMVNPETGQRAVGIAADPEVAAAVLQRRQRVPLRQNLFGAPFLSYYFPLLGAGGNPVGMFFVGLCQEASAAEVSAARRNTILLALLTVVAIGVIISILTSRILRPIRLLTGALKDTAQGDLTKRLPDAGNDEIAEASRSFNQTMGELRGMITAIKGQAGTLGEIGSDLAGNMAQTASSMSQIAANIQIIKGRVINQSASVTQTNATMEQVTANIGRLSGQVDSQTGAVSQASSAIEQMIANIQSVSATLAKNVESVRELQESSEAGKSGLQEMARDIQDIARESEGLLGINAVMENIASQTNLLSMNAAIEAARAGESGRGFAVVAGEIRQLAESSSEQSKTIGEALKKIKDSMDKIARSSEGVLDRFEAIDRDVKIVAEQEEGIRRAMEEQAQGGRQVLGAAGQVGEITGQVRGSSIEMLEGSREVIRESKSLEKATREITGGINEMAAGAEQVNRAVSAVSDLTGKTRENISSLAQAVSQFKV